MKLGQYNNLKIDRKTSVGFYLIDRGNNEVLLPNKYIEPNFKIGDIIKVFVYKDYLHRLIATTLKPYIILHHFASLEVKSVSEEGAFLNWGLEKDLFVPYSEQKVKMQQGYRYIVFMYRDEVTDRLVASAKVNRFFEKDLSELKQNDKVNVMVFETTPLGYNVIINHKYKGLIYHNEALRTYKIGERFEAFIKEVREDGGIDVSPSALGLLRLEDGAEKVLSALHESKDRFLPLNDNSSPEAIFERLGMSKKTFKRAVGMLYKNKRIQLEESGLRLIE